MQSIDTLRQIVQQGMAETLEDLRRLVQIPSIATEGFPQAEVERSAQITVDILRSAGLQDVRILDIPDGYPAVYGEVPAPEGAPTVLLYAHHDVQPAGDPAEWKTQPFELTEHNGRYYGRGAADDKSGVVTHAAVLRAFGGKPPVGLKIIIEGEEEFGSSLGPYVKHHPDLFKADAIVVADMGNRTTGTPTLTTALRGSTSFVVEVRTLKGRIHSGMYGGPTPDALIALSKMLATLHDERGNVAVEGLKGYQWPVAEEKEEDFRALIGVLPGVDLLGDGSLETRLWSSYSVNAVALDAPAVQGSSNVLLNVARARVSLRVPPTEDPHKALALLEEHLRKVTPWHAQVTFSDYSYGPGFAMDADGPVFAAARQALKDSYGKEVSQMGSGGSIPLISDLKELYPQSTVILWGCEDPQAQVHAPNESVDIQDLRHTILAEVLFLNDLAQAISR